MEKIRMDVIVAMVCIRTNALPYMRSDPVHLSPWGKAPVVPRIGTHREWLRGFESRLGGTLWQN
jgi:hypothetical protein